MTELSAVPAVSVITATFNRAQVLPGALRSVLRQELSDFEYLIVDDGSSDRTIDALRPFLDDPRIRYMKTANQGQPAALNLGLRSARAPLVAFLDSDDEYKPTHLSLLTRELRSGDYDFLLGSFELIVCSGGPEPQVTDFYNQGRRIPVREIECITGVLFGRRDVFLELGGFRDMAFSDTDLFQRTQQAGYRWKRLDVPTYRYFFGRCADSLAKFQSR